MPQASKPVVERKRHHRIQHNHTPHPGGDSSTRPHMSPTCIAQMRQPRPTRWLASLWDAHVGDGQYRWCRYAQPPAKGLDACGMRFIEEIAGHWSLRYALLLKRLRNIGEIRGQDRLSLGIRTRRVHRN